MTETEISEIIKFLGAALVGAAVSILTTFINAWQANKRLKIEIQEKKKDRRIKFTEKLSDRIIASYVRIYQDLIHFKDCMYFQNDYLTGDWFWGLEQPDDLLNMNDMYNRLCNVIREHEIWLHVDCVRQLNKLRWELQQGREADLKAGADESEETKNLLFSIYSRVITEIDNSLKTVRISIGVDSFDDVLRDK